MKQTEPPSVVGQGSNFWLFTHKDGFDLTHPTTPSSPLVYPRLTLGTTKEPVTVAPAKTALVIIDMQNLFLSTALGRSRGEGHTAEENLLRHGIPAARRAGIQVIWVNWGISKEQIRDLLPIVWRVFGWKAADRGSVEVDDETPAGTTVPEKKRGGGVGSPMGQVQLEDGTMINAGNMLMRDQWNTALHDPMERAFQQGLEGDLPDVRFNKQRISGMWGPPGELESFLEQKGITTLLFAGVNTDQCVLATLQDASTKGYDTILLRDGCGTTSPEYARQMVDFNCQHCWGFVSSCEALAVGAYQMAMDGGPAEAEA